MEEVQFQSDNLLLRGELHLPERKNCPGILMCHAMHSEGFRWLSLYRTFARKATERGFACLLFDFRGCGMSEGEFDYGWGEQRDAKSALEFLLNRKEVNATSAFIVGRSLGGTISIYSLVDDPRIKGYALWATPPDHYQNIKTFIEKRRGKLGYAFFVFLSIIDKFHDATRVMKIELFGLNLRPKDVRGKLMSLSGARLLSRKNHSPILLAIGDKDDYVTLAEEKRYEKSILGRRRLVVLPETGHTFKGAEEKVSSMTLDWFEELQSSHQ